MTRKEAEQRALELYPDSDIITVSVFNSNKRHAYMRCFDDMQKAQQKKALIELTEMGSYQKNVDEVTKEDLQKLLDDSEKEMNNMTKAKQSESDECPNCGTKRIEYADAKECPNCETFEPTITSVTNCPTCGAECDVKGEGETHYYVPKTNNTGSKKH